MISTADPSPSYSERLRPGWAPLALALLAGFAAGAVPWVFDATAGYLTGGVVAVGLLVLLVVGSPRVVVTAGEAMLPASLQAGSARIEVEHLGAPEVLDPEAMRRAMGPEAHPLAYVCQRPWVHTGVKVPVTDERDPAPYWLIASRRPVALAGALRDAAQAAHSEQTSWPPSS